ncbi:MAG: alkaline phosphatase D family protein, partial [Bryobacteraceae bacterium]|nr:alkaline phosphatase D family protein [Bryobacteraceae bacterium]
VRHILPAASHDRVLIKASFALPVQSPILRVGDRRVTGVRTDSTGTHAWFDAPGLAPSRPYALQLFDGSRALNTPWTLKTLPAPGARLEKLRLLIYTCAGGDERSRTPKGEPVFRSLAVRRALLDRALTFAPDAVIANGDHVYWDLQQGDAPPPRGVLLVDAIGRFRRDLPLFGSPNEAVLKRIVDAQITQLYQTRLQATPVFFLTDDHDYFENDDATDRMVTFPPDAFMLAASRAVRRLAFPEFLPDAGRPLGLGGSCAPDSPPGCSENFGTLRWGTLAEILLYDCRRFLRLDGRNATFLPRETEAWLAARMAAHQVDHVVNIPSTPPGWSAGKWGEWYPDILADNGKLTTAKPKPFWQEGWFSQHNRLLSAASAMRDRIPLFVSGDLHALGEGVLHASSGADFRANPVRAILSGPLGTAWGWPSTFRGIRAIPPSGIEIDEKLPTLEEDGFLILDFTPEVISARWFRWSPAAGEDQIPFLQPFRETIMKRGSRA